MSQTVKFNHTPLPASLVLIAHRAVLDERCARMTLAQSEGLKPEQTALIIHLSNHAGEECGSVQIIVRAMGDRLLYGVAETFGEGRQSQLQAFQSLDRAIEYAVSWFAKILNEYTGE